MGGANDMSGGLVRYSRIDTHMKREFLLLMGTGCVWRKCLFCDYYSDIGDDPFSVNRPVIDRVTGVYGTVDAINSGSVFEIDERSLGYLRDKMRERNVHTLWLESHWMYRERLDEMRGYFEGIDVKFRTGIETFDGRTREKWRKGIPSYVTAEEAGEYFDGVCLLVCVEGQTKEMIRHDIEKAMSCFEYFNINVFEENSGPLKRDDTLFRWFRDEMAPGLERYDNIEVLMNNTDLGVG